MKILQCVVFYALFGFLCACGENNAQINKYKINPQAKKLNDSAIFMSRSFDSLDIEKAISLLNKATKMDSNYYLGYWNKMSLYSTTKQYEPALISAQRMQKIKPEAPEPFVIAGILKERMGDTVFARQEFQKALQRYNAILDTMKIENKNYDITLISKAVILIFAEHEKKGNALLHELYNKQTDEQLKKLLKPFMDKSRREILDDFKI